MMSKKLSLCFALLYISPNIYAECSSTNAIKIQQCLFKEVSYLKNELELAYKNIHDDIATRKEIEITQLEWLKYKKDVCGAVTYEKKDYNLIQNIQILECERKMISNRISQLNKLN